jgi:hypothetical protein
VRAVEPKAIVSLDNDLKLPKYEAESFRLIEMAGKELDVSLLSKGRLSI